MTPTTALVYWLRDDPALAALVEGRIYQSRLPQSPDYPAVVLHTVSEPQLYHLRGIAGVIGTRVQTDSYAQEDGGDAKFEVDQVAAAVDARLSGRIFAAGGLRFLLVRRMNRIDPPFEGAEVQAFRVMLEYLVWTRLE